MNKEKSNNSPDIISRKYFKTTEIYIFNYLEIQDTIVKILTHSLVRYGNLDTWINLPRFHKPRYNLGRFYLRRYYPS